MNFEIKLDSLYVCVKDMERAINFYEQLFNHKVYIKDEVFSVFQVGSFRFCLFDNSKVKEQVTWGDNCLPSFQVNDMNILLNKLKELACEIVFPLTKIKDNWVLEFKDSEGNDIEAYCHL
ncbi:VOC family protein [Clostridium sp. 19966]|uniref:VOC family protein n=1 Tax=Clostridium sp. 19966 TaxID=2768166 RepID=UPI0028DDA60A|nr:VOC family protein [Clostridium sp. 19966]MDT8718344.1 VOC family protein [Clostridium sp. 19966]